MHTDGVWLADVQELRDLIDEAYAEARTKVFDLEGPRGDPRGRTLEQRQIVQRLEALEERLRQLRDRHG